MPQLQFDIRAELPHGQFRDFRVGGETLNDARQRAQDHIETDIMGLSPYAAAPRYDWRGQVVFINSQPCEEVVSGQK